MNENEIEEEPVTVGHLVGRVERIMSLRQEGTETLRRLWTAGDVERLPCSDDCTGDIAVSVKGLRIRGFCPAHMVAGVCPLVTKEERELKHRMTRAGFGPRYHNPDRSLIRAGDTIDAYLASLTENVEKGRGLILAGGVGVGKTMAMAYLARRLLIAGRGVWCVLMEKLITGLMSREQRGQVVRRALSVEVLIIDDFGAGEMPTYVLSMLEMIVEHRNGHLKPTMVTTNMTKEQLTAAPEFRRIVDRFRESNRLVTVGGDSMRGSL